MLLQGFPRRPFIYSGSSLQGQVDPQNHHSQYFHLIGLRPSRQKNPENHHSQYSSRTSRPSKSSQSILSTSSPTSLSSLEVGKLQRTRSQEENLKLPELEIAFLDARVSRIFYSNVLLHQGTMVQCICVVKLYNVFRVFL